MQIEGTLTDTVGYIHAYVHTYIEFILKYNKITIKEEVIRFRSGCLRGHTGGKGRRRVEMTQIQCAHSHMKALN